MHWNGNDHTTNTIARQCAKHGLAMVRESCQPGAWAWHALEPKCFLLILPPRTPMEIYYVYMYLARGPQLTVRFVGLAAHTAAPAHSQHGLEDRQ